MIGSGVAPAIVAPNVWLPTLEANPIGCLLQSYAVFRRISRAGQAARFVGRLGWQQNSAQLQGLIKIARGAFTDAGKAAGILSPGRHRNPRQQTQGLT
jgi:hypothetical protein